MKIAMLLAAWLSAGCVLYMCTLHYAHARKTTRRVVDTVAAVSLVVSFLLFALRAP